MRGADEQTGALFSYLSPEAMVPKDHPLRAIRPLVNAALARLSPAFARLYAPTGRVSIAPEKLLRTLLLQAFYSGRSERQLMEQLTYNMLFRWFIWSSMAHVWTTALVQGKNGGSAIWSGAVMCSASKDAVRMTAGHDEFHGSGPNHLA